MRSRQAHWTVAAWLLAALAMSSGARSAPGERQGMAASATETLEALWQALKEHYPMMEYAGARGDEWLEEFRPKVAAAPTREAALWLMDELVCRLNDYHTVLLWPGRAQHVPPLVRVEEVADGRRAVVAIVAAAPETGLKPGEELLAVDGRPVREAMEEAAKHSVGATAAARSRNACWRMLLGPQEQPIRLRVRAGNRGAGREVAVRRDLPAPREPVVSPREVEGVPVIRITRWGDRGEEKVVATFDRLLERFRERPHLVIDVRGNGGGSDAMADEVTGRFLAQRVISSISFHRLVPELTYRRTVEWAQPRGPWRYEGRFAVLIDEGCASACEHFVSGMAAAGAFLAGSPTNGACGWMRQVTLPGNARLIVSQTFPLHGKTPSPLQGIAPHAHAPLTRRDLREGRDAALSAALTWLKSGKPLPPRLQPVE